MKVIRIALTALCVGLAVPAAVGAQSVVPLSIEGNVGVGVPTGDFGDAADPSYGLGATVIYDLGPMLGLRAGYSYQRFGVSEGEVEFDADADYTDSGFALGLELNPVLGPGLNLLLHADAILHRLKISASEEGLSGSFTSDHSFGFDLGAGLAFPVGPRVSIVPRVRYRQYDAEFDFGGGEPGEGSISYFAGGVGLRFQL